MFAAICAAVVVVMLGATRHARAEGAAVESPARVAFDRACEQLRRSAVSTPYGWGWPGGGGTSAAGADAGDAKAGAGAASKKPRDRNAQGDIDVRTTAATGLVLQFAGRTKNYGAFTHAAVEAARGLAAVQLQTGQMPPTARLLPRPGGLAESIGIVPDRGPTCAALALMLVVIDATKDKPDPGVLAAATRAATWLARQPTNAGGWQAAYPPGAGLKARRLIRLDEPGYRDSTFALLLASRVLGRREYTLTADRCVDELLKVRIRAEGATGQGLWAAAASLGGEPVDDIAELPPGADLLATGYAIETLLAMRVVADHGNLDNDLSAAAKTITALPKPGGHWQRRYVPFPKNTPAATASAKQETETTTAGGASTDGKSTDGKATDGKTKEPPVADPFSEDELTEVLRAAHVAQTAGVKTWTESTTGLSLIDRMAVTLCGLTSHAFDASPTAAKPGAGVPGPAMEAWKMYLATTEDPKAANAGKIER